VTNNDTATLEVVMNYTQKDIEYAIREAEIMYWSIKDSPSKTQILNCATRLSGAPLSTVEKAYNTLKVADINR